MSFELKNPTIAIISSVTPRIEKHGDENVPAITLGIQITGPNTLLDLIVPGLRDVLYKPANDDMDTLPGVEQSTPLLRSRAMERIKLKMPQMEGWTLEVEHGIDETTAIKLSLCKVDKFSLEPFEGGSVELSFRVGTSDVDERYMGELAMKLGSEVPIMLLAPAVKPGAIDGSQAAFERDHPGMLSLADGSLFDADADDATAAFVATGGGEGLDADQDEASESAIEDAEFEAGVRQALSEPRSRRSRRSVGAME